MKNTDYDKYSTEELRDMLRQFVEKLTEKQCGEVLEELNS